jgi:hypothetical protein
MTGRLLLLEGFFEFFLMIWVLQPPDFHWRIGAFYSGFIQGITVVVLFQRVGVLGTSKFTPIYGIYAAPITGGR